MLGAHVRHFQLKSSNRNLSTGKKPTTKLWGGRFSKDTDPSVARWVDSIPIDRHLAEEDIWGSMAHVTMLGIQGIIPIDSATKILPTLQQFQQEYLAGKWDIGEYQDDVHMDVEHRLILALGAEVGGRMHTCRSRNDQVALAAKFYARKRLLEVRKGVIEAVRAFLDKAQPHLETIMVGYTHVQQAQPISLAFYLSHFASVLLRDLTRLKAAYDTTDENPLGAGAISGTSFPIDRNITTLLMGFQKIHEHSLDAIGNRDAFLETIQAVAIMYNTLTRLADEWIMWSSWEFGSITLDDGFAMGSSMMPNKKNPGTLELLRGRSGRINGLANAGLTLMKGLPCGYDRDFHEDKEILVEQLDLAKAALSWIPTLIHTTTFNEKRLKELSYANFSSATEIANYLVAQHNVPFREAHHIVGSLVGHLTRAGKNFSDVDTCYEHITKKHNIKCSREDLEKYLNTEHVVKSYNSLGGTGPKATEAMIRKFYDQLAQHETVLKADTLRVSTAHEATRNIAKAAATVKSASELRALVKKHGYNI